MESWFRQDEKWLAWAVMIYGLAASILPVWLLLTPRDYLSTFLKLGTVAALAAAVVLLRPDPFDAVHLAVHRWFRSSFCRTGLPLCLHHNCLRSGLRIPLAHCLGNDLQNGRARVAHSRHWLRRDGY